MITYFIKHIFILGLCFAMSACVQSGSVPTTAPTASATLIPTVTKTTSPTRTPTATITPYPTLSAKKPYLMMQQSERVFFEYDAEGWGRKIIELPPDGYIPVYPRLANLVSPDGEWLVFYTGDLGLGDSLENLPIAINLLSIRSGKVLKIADVVSDGYKEKLVQLAEDLRKLYPDKYQLVDGVDWLSNSVLSAFTWSIHSLRWSPDGHKLAFAAQIDGISSDVFLYNLETGFMQHIESSIQNVSNIKWSPDGKFVVFENSEPGYIYTGSSLYAVEPADRVIENPKRLYRNTWLHIGYWLSPNILLVADGTDTAGNFNLQTLDISTGQLRPLWKDSVGDYAIDPLNKIIVLNAGEFAEPENFGIYFITFNGRKTKILDGLYQGTLFFRDGEQHRFLFQGISEKGTHPTLSLSGDIVGLDLNGKSTRVAGQFAYDKIKISPDNSWLLLYDSKNLFLYDTNDNLVRTFPISGIYSVVWRPDSQAIFFSDGKSIYFLPIPNGEPRLIIECEQYSCSLEDIAWVP